MSDITLPPELEKRAKQFARVHKIRVEYLVVNLCRACYAAGQASQEAELAELREALQAIWEGVADQLAFVHKMGERAARVSWDTEAHSQTPEAFQLEHSYESDARYQYPAREKLVRQVARLALQHANTETT